MSTTYGLHRALQFDRDATATLFGDRVRSWGEVGERVARLAGALQKLGVGRGDRVAILLLNSDRYVELYLAIAWAGAVVVPLNIRWSLPENQACIEDCRPKLLIVDAAFAKMGEPLARGLSLVYADDVPEARPASALDYEQILAACRACR